MPELIVRPPDSHAAPAPTGVEGSVDPQLQERVKHPIRYKIFGITGLLIALMALVTLVSTINLGRVDRQMNLLSDYYIPLDQTLSDIRYHHLSQTLALERMMADRPQRPFNSFRAEVDKLADKLGSCEDRNFYTASRPLRETLKDPGDKALLSYELHRYCTDKRSELAMALVGKALELPMVNTDPVLVRQFAEMQGELRRIPEARLALNNSVRRFAEQSATAGARAAELLKEQMETNRRTVSRTTGNVARMLHGYTREAAAKANHVEQRTSLFNWLVTLCAAVLGVLFAALITRNLIKTVRALLSGAIAVERGDLSIAIQVKSADEMELLARTFNFMVNGLREKESIKETFGKYIDPRIVKDLLEEHSFSEVGAKRTMTVFFSDIEGFTPICEQLSADGVVKLLNSYFSLMSKPIRTRNGIIDKYIGDSIMAFWGPPFTDEREHALLACEAALDQLARLDEFRLALPDIIGLRRGLPAFNIRVGLCTGDVTAGSVGSEAAKSYTVIGDTVNLASRLEAANKTFGTALLISEATRNLAGEAMETRDLHCIRVPGKTESARVYELLGRAGEVDGQRLALRDRFEAGLACYLRRDWDAAGREFGACLEMDGDDRPSRLFLGRVERYRLQPPPPDWDGVLDLEK